MTNNNERQLPTAEELELLILLCDENERNNKESLIRRLTKAIADRREKSRQLALPVTAEKNCPEEAIEAEYTEIARDAKEDSESYNIQSAKAPDADDPTVNEIEVLPKDDGGFKSKGVSIFTVAAVFILCALIAGGLWFTNNYSLLKVTGDSMYPTYSNGDVIAFKRLDDYENGTPCVIKHAGLLLVKRIVADEGQYFEVDEDGSVYVDGQKKTEPYINSETTGRGDIEYPHIVEKDCCVVLGDNRSESKDSRLQTFGDVDKSEILGAVQFKIWPIPFLGK